MIDQVGEVDVITGKIKDKILAQRYLVGKYIDHGSNGIVYKVSDTQNKFASPLVIKIQELDPIVMQEIETLKFIKNFTANAHSKSKMKGSILEIVDHGQFIGVDCEKLDESNSEISD